MKDINILMTGAGAPGAPGIIRCYRNNGERNVSILGADVKDRVPTAMVLDSFAQIPSALSTNYVDEVLELALENKIDVIQPLVTKELEIFAQHEEKFKKDGIAVCVSPIENLCIANDKGLLLERLDFLGVETPRYKKVKTIDEFETACLELGYPKKPICFKPTKANGSRGFRVIDPHKNMGDLLFKEKPNSTYADYESVKKIFNNMEYIPELLVMEYMPGDEYSVDMLLDKGKALYAIPRIRLRMNGGISTCCRVVYEQDVIDYCIEIAEKLMLHGNIGIQVRRAENGKAKILEINPRVQGTIVACAAAGVNLPYYGIKLALGEEIPHCDIKWGTLMERCWQEVYFDTSGYAFAY